MFNEAMLLLFKRRFEKAETATLLNIVCENCENHGSIEKHSDKKADATSDCANACWSPCKDHSMRTLCTCIPK